MPDPNCPSSDDLKAFLLGQLKVEQIDQVASHVDDCPTCEETIVALEHQSDTVLSRLRNPKRSEHTDDGEYKKALAFVKNIGRDATIAGKNDTDDDAPPIGNLREYELLEKLGEGGMGAVYRARHSKLDKVVAIKVLPAERMKDAGAVARFEREMRAVGKLDHPNIVRAMDAGEVDGMHFLVMEYVRGQDLSQLIRRVGPLPVADACELIRQAAVGLDDAHESEMVHRDIKPSNLMLAEQRRKPPVVKILDMGLALLSEAHSPDAEGLTTTGQLMGTLDYMAPEQGGDSHEVDIRADIYALGATLYRLLTGKPIYFGPNYQTPVQKLMALATEPAPAIQDRRDEVPDGLAAIVHKMLQKNPDDRIATPADVVDALEPFCEGADLQALVGTSPAVSPESETAVSVLDISAPSSSTTDLIEEAKAIDTVPPIRKPLANADQITARSVSEGRAPHRALFSLSSRIPPKWRLPAMIGGSLGGLALIALAVILLIPTGKGTLKVVIHDPKIEVTVQSTDLVIKGTDREAEIRVTPGLQQLKIVRGDFEFFTDKFELKRGGETIVEVLLLPDGKLELKQDGEMLALKESADGPVLAAAPVVITPDPNAALETGEPISPDRKVSPATIDLEPESQTIAVGEPLSPTALVSWPAKIDGVASWTIEAKGHRGEVRSVRYSPDGKWIASCGQDRTVRIWEAKTLRLVRILVGGSGGIAWSPDSRVVASGGPEQTIRLWDPITGRLLKTFGGASELPYDVGYLDWSPDGKLLVAAGGQPTIWDIASGRRLHMLSGHAFATALVHTPAKWSPDGTVLAYATRISSLQGIVRRWSRETEQYLEDIRHGEGLYNSVVSINWSLDGKRLFSYAPQKDQQKSTRIWDNETGKLVHEIDGASPCPSPDGSQIAIVRGTKLQFIDAASYKLIRQVETDNFHILSLDWSPDAKMIAVGSRGNIQLWDVASAGMIAESVANPAQIHHVRWSPDRTRIVFCGSGISIFDTQSGERLQHNTRVPSEYAAWSPHGKMIASRAGYNAGLAVWDANTGKTLRKFDVGDGYESPWSPNEKWLAIDCKDKVLLWNTATGQLVRTMKCPFATLSNLRWSPDSKTLGRTTGHAKDAVMWNVETGERLHTFDDKIAGTFRWSPDGKTIAVASGNDIRLLNSQSGELIDCLAGHQRSPYSLRWSADGGTLFSYDGRTIREWGIETGTRRTVITRSRPTSELSPYGKFVATRTDIYSSVIELWRTSDGKRCGTIAFLRDAQPLAVSSAGHFRAPDIVARRLVYVVLTDDGEQLTLSPKEFAKKYGWRNDPSQVKLLPTTQTPPSSAQPKTPDPNRVAAEWVLGIGGKITTDAGDFKAVAELPQKPFRIVSLDLSGRRQVTDDDLEHLKGLTKLTHLNLFNTKISDVGLEHLKELTNLEFLLLQITQVTDAGLEHLQGLTNLTHLSLSSTRVSDAGLKHLKGLTNLKVLHLNKTQVEGAGLEHIKGLTKLTELTIWGTRVGDTGLEHFKGLTNLTKLNLDVTQVSDTGLENLKGLTKLRLLELTKTQVTAGGVAELKKALPKCKIKWDDPEKTDPDRAVAEWVLGIGGTIEIDADKFTEVGQLPKQPFQITTVRLIRNQRVTDADLEKFKGLANLVDIQLSDTQITDAGLAHLDALTNLMHLHLGGTQVRGAGLVHLKGLPKLTSLALYRTKVGDEGLEHLQGITTLTFLNLAATQVRDAGLEHLTGLTNLRDLRLAGTKISDAGLVHLKALTNLNVLAIGVTQVSDAGMEQLKRLKNLTELSLFHAQVGDAGLEHLKALTKLQKLGLRGTKVTAQGIAEFKKARPKCNIKWDDPEKSDPNRTVAEWVLGIGGSIETIAGKFTEVGQLPKQPFVITLVNLKGQQQVTDADLVKLKGLTNLTALELSSTRITDNGLEHLKKLTSLKHLRLNQTKVTAKGVAELRKALPNCKIREP